MKKRTNLFCYNIALLLLVLLLVGCAGDTDSESGTHPSDSKNESALESEEETNGAEESGSTTVSAEASGDDSNDTSSEELTNEKPSSNTYEDDNASGSEEDNPLSEYARVWLQLGDMKDVDELNVHQIPAGTPLNPDDETSAAYPEDVIQLAGGRLVAGSVMYSGNGDGTINVYNVPLRWDGEYPAGEEFYEDIIENTSLEQIDTGDDEEIIELIDKMNVD
ncbi:hypothetical protein [Virgibacillus sp. CBA3643]|uniref:hypothetical protein n=1 Tax=Virgibacillus sp. CBA3643 TaxID=2942278 RepID=UPI0035A2F4D8